MTDRDLTYLEPRLKATELPVPNTIYVIKTTMVNIHQILGSYIDILNHFSNIMNALHINSKVNTPVIQFIV